MEEGSECETNKELFEHSAGETLPDSPNKNKVFKKPPSRQKFEEDLVEIKQKIEDVEKKIQSLSNAADPESPQARLQKCKEDREASNQQRRSINNQLESLNQQINNKRDATAQLRSKLQYQTEAQIDQVVRRLEAQLQHHSFRIAEERRLVAEIDKLRRSKKSVKQYNESNDELQKLRDSQHSLRQERDSLSKELYSFRSQEDALHNEIRKTRETLDLLKKELDELYDKKRSRVAEFKAEQASFQQGREQRRLELQRQRTQDKFAQSQAKAQDREEIRYVAEPYQEERHLCATLMSFLSKLEIITPVATPATPRSSFSSVSSTPMTPDDARCRLPGFREEEESSGMDSLFVGMPRRSSRKVKRSNSKATLNKKRPVPLTPDLLSQFASLDITAPATLAEVLPTMEALKAKQKLFTCMANAELRQDESKVGSPEVLQQNVSPDSLSLNLPSSSCTQNSQSSNEVKKLSPKSLSLSLDLPLGCQSVNCTGSDPAGPPPEHSNDSSAVSFSDTQSKQDVTELLLEPYSINHSSPSASDLHDTSEISESSQEPLSINHEPRLVCETKDAEEMRKITPESVNASPSFDSQVETTKLSAECVSVNKSDPPCNGLPTNDKST